MKKYYESELPEGYREALVIDAANKKFSLIFTLASSLIAALLIFVFYKIYVAPRITEIAAGYSMIKYLGFMLAMILYIILHELTHGLVYKIMTKQKLTYGFTLTVAYCGVPNIYTYRITALLSLLAPFTVFNIVFVLLFFLVNDPFIKMLILIMLSLHVSGCIGDLYDTFLFLFKFKDPATLMNDTGPKQTFYVKD